MMRGTRSSYRLLPVVVLLVLGAQVAPAVAHGPHHGSRMVSAGFVMSGDASGLITSSLGSGLVYYTLDDSTAQQDALNVRRLIEGQDAVMDGQSPLLPASAPTLSVANTIAGKPEHAAIATAVGGRDNLATISLYLDKVAEQYRSFGPAGFQQFLRRGLNLFQVIGVPILNFYAPGAGTLLSDVFNRGSEVFGGGGLGGGNSSRLDAIEKQLGDLTKSVEDIKRGLTTPAPGETPHPVETPPHPVEPPTPIPADPLESVRKFAPIFGLTIVSDDANGIVVKKSDNSKVLIDRNGDVHPVQ